jgi:TonB family protein
VSVQGQVTTPRKLLTHVTPKYPEYLKEHEIGGSVRMNVVVTPNGNVKTVIPVGGNPILLNAAIDAVKQWKYAPAETTDTFEVKLDFVPRQ